jgi:hypothetical protein
MRTFITRLSCRAPTTIFTKQPLTTNTFRTFTMSSTTYSSNSSAPTEQQQPETSNNDAPKAPLALPAAPANATQLDMSTGGTTVSLDHLGPMVVNVDGTMSRISNWDKMAEIEKKNTLRIIGKRNKERLAALKGAAAAQGEGEEK